MLRARLKITVLCLFALNFGLLSASSKSESAAQVILNIVNNPERYNKDLRPVLSENEPVNVQSQMYIKHIAVDDINMMVKVDLIHRLFWKDPRLVFEAEVNSVRFSDCSKFWIPDIFVGDSLKSDSSETIGPQTLLQIDQDGSIMHSKRLILNLKCDMDITRFPHDLQNCPITFESYAYDKTELVLKLKEDGPVSCDQNIQIVQKFSLVDVSSEVFTSETKTGEYSTIQVTLQMQRKFYAYFLEWYLPLMIYTMMAFLSLYVTDLFTRVFLTVIPLTVILASILYYSQNLPSVPYVTRIDIFAVVTVIAIITPLLYAVVTHYIQMNTISNGKVEVEKNEKWRRLYDMLKMRSNFFTKFFIIGFYLAFVFLYFIFFVAFNPASSK